MGSKRNYHLDIPVIKLDPETGEFIAKYENMTIAGKENYLHRSSIHKAIKGIRLTSAGFRWVKESDFRAISSS